MKKKRLKKKIHKLELQIKELQEKNIFPDLFKFVIASSVAKVVKKIYENKENRDSRIIKKSKEEGFPIFVLSAKDRNAYETINNFKKKMYKKRLQQKFY